MPYQTGKKKKKNTSPNKSWWISKVEFVGRQAGLMFPKATTLIPPFCKGNAKQKKSAQHFLLAWNFAVEKMITRKEFSWEKEEKRELRNYFSPDVCSAKNEFWGRTINSYTNVNSACSHPSSSVTKAHSWSVCFHTEGCSKKLWQSQSKHVCVQLSKGPSVWLQRISNFYLQHVMKSSGSRHQGSVKWLF